MKVSLIDYTGIGLDDDGMYAANILLFTKNTRLQMSPGLLSEIRAWPLEKKMKELEYMANTIPSSWEMVNYSFMVEDVTRGYTHQQVRSRNMSFAQQTLRVLDVTGWKFGTGPTIQDSPYRKQLYNKVMEGIDVVYKELIKDGAKIEDARGILPTNILTNIFIHMNLRTFVETVRKRSSPRVQGEYREVLEKMKDEVIKVHPWCALFIDRTWDRAAKDLDKEISDIQDQEKKIRMMKLLDQLRQIEP